MSTTEKERADGTKFLPPLTMALWIGALLLLMQDAERPFRRAGMTGVALMLVPGLFYAYGLGWATAKTMPRPLWLPTIMVGCFVAFRVGEFVAVQIAKGG